MTTIGKVFLIGAGPGDPGLITVKAKEALAGCDAVVYDRLVSLELVVTLPRRVKRYYAGKSAGKHSLKQSQINELLLKLAKEGHTIARLKGGDPFVFGRGGEEAVFLRGNGIDVEVIPGVTAGIAGLAYAGIPLTHRGKSAYAIFITAHEAPGKELSDLPWELLSGAEKGTIVGYMGVKTLPEVTERLIAGGMDEETPAAVIERGTLGNQSVIIGKLGNIALKAGEAGVKPPALFVIGEVVELRDSIIVEEDKPLAGKTIMVTRPGGQAAEIYHKLRKLGAEVLALPTIATEGYLDNEGWKRFERLRGGWLIFTSENGVKYFFQGFLREGGDFRRIAKFSIASIGAGTEKALKQYGFKTDFVPSKYTVNTLAEELTSEYEWKGVNAVRVRGNLGDDIIEAALEKAGAKVLPLEVYLTFTAEWDEGMRAAFAEAEIDAVTFSSGSTVAGLVEILGEAEFQCFIESTAVISIGPVTSDILRQAGGEPAIEAKVHTMEGVIDAVVEYFREDKE
ncbi:MAG: uroporphyrinogen-III C-methyltransferase [candidate division Zixibacteria bacterium]|nr:uroporphyrinogen-III C-methyltransferase [Candidatus Tariuqbacter arcticus]